MRSGKVNFGGDCWHGVVSTTEEEGHGGVKHFEFIVVIVEIRAVVVRGIYFVRNSNRETCVCINLS